MTLGRSRGLAEGSGHIGASGSEQWNEGAGFYMWDRAKPDTGPASEVSGWGALSREGSGGAGDSRSQQHALATRRANCILGCIKPRC